MSHLMEEPADIKVGAEIAGGKYHLVRRLGAGGMGFVWEARQMGMGGFQKPVALKLMFEPNQPKEARRLFLNEARLSARLHHPNLIEIYDLGQEDGLDYIAMELIDGIDLGALLEAREVQGLRGVPWEMAATIVLEACKGLSYAHRKKDHDGSPLRLIHRDLKPGNILISTDGFVKIIDFGIAKSEINTGKTRTGVVKGTPAYMPPEQLAAKPLDERTDIYAMGAILYELCCGRAAFEGDTLFSVLFAVQTKQPLPPSQLVPGLPERIETIILRCLSKNREARYSTAKDLQRALESALVDSQIRIEHEELGQMIESLLGREVTVAHGLPSAHSDDPTPTEREPLPSAAGEAHTFDALLEGDGGDLGLSNTQPFAAKLSGLPAEPSDSIQLSTGDVPKPTSSPPKAQRATAWLAGLSAAAVCLLAAVWLYGVSKPRKAPQHRAHTPRGLVSRPKAPTRQPHHRPAPRATKLPLRQVVTKRIAPPTRRPQAPVRRPRQRLRRKAARRVVRRPRRPQPRKATLLIDITPRCQLLEGTTHLGISNGARLTLAPGSHTLRCVNYNKRFAHRFQIRLRAGVTTRIKKRFRRGRLFVLSFPFATLSLSAYGASFGHIGRSHDAIALYEGSYRLTLYKLGNVGSKRNIHVVIKPGQLTRPKVIW